MKWAGTALTPWLVACLASSPAPSESVPPTGPTEPAAQPSSTSATQASVSETVAGQPPAAFSTESAPATSPAPPIAVEASFEPPRPAASPRKVEGEVPEVETRSVSFGADLGTVPCSVGGRAAQCIELAEGPWLVTDYEALDGCSAALYLAGSTKSEAPAAGKLELSWAVRVSERGVHGARIAVAANSKLLAAMEPRRRHTNDARCSITWSGQRLRDSKGLATQPTLMESPYR